MHKLTIALVVILLLVALPITAQEDDFMAHTECNGDLTGQTVTIYHLGDLSGAYAFITQPLLAGIEDAIDYYNEAGTLCGATLTQEYEDTGGDQSVTQSAYDRFSTLDPKPVGLTLYSSDDSELLRDRLAEDEIPVLLSGGSVAGLYGENADEPGWIFATNPNYVDQLGMFCDYVAANPDRFPDASIGYISWEGAFGHAADTEEVWGYCDSVGVGHAGSEYFLPSSQDITNQVQNLVDNGATILYTNSLASGPVLVSATVATLALDVDVAGVNWVLDTSVGLLGQAAFGPDGLPVVNGLLGSMPFYWWSETDQPGIRFITERFEAAGRSGSTRNVAYLLSWIQTDYFIEAYIQTGNRVGFENVTGATMKDTYETMEYNPFGLQNIAFTEGLRDSPLNRIAEMRFLGEDGTPAVMPDNPPVVVNGYAVPIIVPLTDFEETPDLKPGGADVPME